MREAREPAVQPAPRRPAAVVDPDLIEAARILRGTLVRVHPSFRFEERLAARLGTAAEVLAHRNPVPRARRGGDLIRFPGIGQPAVRVPRRVLIGGAIASGVSLAGAAYLARRWLTRGA